MQNLFSNQEPQKREIKLPDAEVVFYESFFSEIESKKIFKALKENLEWQQKEIKLFGKLHLEPRLTAWYGTKAYTYSGIKMKAKAFTKELLEIIPF